LFLTCSYDWTVRLWSSRATHPLFTFEGAKDYVYDVQWSPVHPAMFASCDGTGRVDIWDLSADTEVPVHTVRVTAATITPASSPTNVSSPTTSTPSDSEREEKEGPACSRLRWSDDGLSLAVGTSSGHVVIFAIADVLALPSKDTAANFSQKVAKALVPTA
jgi:dynein intermediate chain